MKVTVDLYYLYLGTQLDQWSKLTFKESLEYINWNKMHTMKVTVNKRFSRQ